MPKVTAAITAATVLVVMLTGCAGTVTPAPTEAAPTATAGLGTDHVGPAATDAPLVATTPASAAGGDEAAYLVKVRDLLAGIQTQIPDATDDQLVTAGRDACTRYASGENWETMSVIEGEKPNSGGRYIDTVSILTAARAFLCP